MKEQLIKAINRNQMLDIIYLSKNNEITKRRIKIIKILDDNFVAYCLEKHSVRTFIIDNVLALMPVGRKVRETA